MHTNTYLIQRQKNKIRERFNEKSKNWKMWYAILDVKTCRDCRKKHGSIYQMNETPNPKPPLHFSCRCDIVKMRAILAGNATKNGVNGADWYLKYYGRLPSYYIDSKSAKKSGWKPELGNLAEIVPNHMVIGGIYYNDDGKLPDKQGRIWYEADINYVSGYRNKERILFSNDGLLFVTYDHYSTFCEIV